PYSWNGLTFTAAGSQTKTGLSNSQGCDSSATLSLTLKANTSSTTNASVCANELPYSWNGLTFTGAGSQTAHLTNVNGCDSAATLILTVNSLSIPSINVTSNTNNVCKGIIVSFTATPTNGGTSPTYQWKKNGVNVGSNNSSYIDSLLNNSDSVWCVLTSNSACATSNTVTSNKVKITVSPRPAIGTNSMVATFCTLSTTKNIYNTNTSGGGVWSSSNQSVATVTSTNGVSGIINAISNGVTTVTYTKTSSSGCVASSSTIISVASEPTPNPITGINSICVGATTSLNTSTSGGSWSSLNNRATVNNAGVVTGSNAGNAFIRYTVTNFSLCSASRDYHIIVNPTPAVPSVAYAPGTTLTGSNSIFFGAPSGSFCVGKSFGLIGNPNSPAGTWSATGAASVTNTGLITINSVGAGTIKYTYTNFNGCSNSRTLSGNGFSCAARGVNTVNSQLSTVDGFTMYPNPARSVVSLQVEKLTGQGQIVITDLYGKAVKTQPLSMGTNTINISSISKGVYFVNTITSEGKTTKRLIIQ
ncbi:MAG: T9SS type A sorting domain-containing protein, partial [Chitinophagaceae bacterium]